MNKTAGMAVVRQVDTRISLAQITDQINDSEAALDALLDLLSQAQRPISPDGLVRLLRPVHASIRRAADALGDHA